MNGEPVNALGHCVVKQDDILQMGASTRFYKVDWLPLSVTEQHSGDTAVSSVECRQSNTDKILERSSPNGSKTTFLYKFNHQVNFLTGRLPVLEVPFNLSRSAYVHEEGFLCFLFIQANLSLTWPVHPHDLSHMLNSQCIAAEFPEISEERLSYEEIL